MKEMELMIQMKQKTDTEEVGNTCFLCCTELKVFYSFHIPLLLQSFFLIFTNLRDATEFLV